MRSELGVVRVFDDPAVGVGRPTATGGNLIYCYYTTFDYVGLPNPVMTTDVAFTVPLTGPSTVFIQANLMISASWSDPIPTGQWRGNFSAAPEHDYGDVVGNTVISGPLSTFQFFVHEDDEPYALCTVPWTGVVTRDETFDITPLAEMNLTFTPSSFVPTVFVTAIVGPSTDSDCLEYGVPS